MLCTLCTKEALIYKQFCNFTIFAAIIYDEFTTIKGTN